MNVNEENESVKGTLRGRTNYMVKMLQDIEPYMDECVELCVLMNIQEPPLELRGLMCSSCTSFDTSAFQPYTKSGTKIDYIVWPAMHLYRGGPLLCKGIAQGMPDPSDVHKPRSIKVKDRQTEHIQERNLFHQSQKSITEKRKSQYYKPGISISTNVLCIDDNMPSSKTKSTHSVFTEEKEVDNSQTDSSESC
ncbi:hypothetical protein CHS0354_030868 [Potamilus streckersoni]|uniref:Mitochondria-eating protein C-terminal domain-containing protein n=1 Tax=Potamilus streckersoni TaxID=2493646 RepID=A0AAE0SMF1_9BIVA|nr:hypothetical protein CHS0354_030868 [Potamilus streckersoni]